MAEKTTKSKITEKVNTLKEDTKKVVAEIADDVKEDTKKKAAEVKKEVKDDVKKAAAGVKKGTEKTAKTVKKTAARVRKPTIKTYVQFGSDEVSQEELAEKALAEFRALHEDTAPKRMELYIKPEDRAAYYVINSEFTGKVDF